MIDTIKMTKCTGCKMCGDICPVNAISYEVNEQGFWYPVVDTDKCIKCEKCIKACPVSEDCIKFEHSRTKVVYAAWSADDNVRRKSTSGGIYYELALWVINNGGYIVGSVYSDDFKSAYHTFSNDMEGLERIMGSKYFQSDTENIYKKVKELLALDKLVLFTGAPCQVSALKHFLNKDYENLLTVDFICKGVPSPLIHKKKIELYEQKKKVPVTRYGDKTKPYGWSNFGETIEFKNNSKHFISRWKDEINNCFVRKNLNVRESCYSCEFKNGENDSDLTIGDFWGITGVTERDMFYGVSAIVVNTEKGENLVKSVGKRIYKWRKPITQMMKGNPAYASSVKRPEARDAFFDYVNAEGLEKAVKKYTKKTVKEKWGNLKLKIKEYIKTLLPVFRYFYAINWFKFIHYNYFCPAIKREKGTYILPYYGAIMDIHKEASIHIKGNIAINLYPCYKRGKSTTTFKIGKGAKVIFNNRLELAYNNTFSVNSNASLETGYLFTGVGAAIICSYKMKFGNNIMLGRDVSIFDSDYHAVYNEEGEVINPDREVCIEDNVWIGAKSMVLKGANIQEGAIVSANSLVMGEVEAERCYINKREGRSIGGKISWER